MIAASEFGYARAEDGAYIAYATLGEGPIDLVWQFDWFGNIDMILQSGIGPLYEQLATFCHVILHDRRATGLSSRNVEAPDLETRVADLVSVLDAVGAERPVLAGWGEGGSPNAMLAATDPQRVRSLIWVSPTARSVWTPDYPWGVRPEYVERDQRSIDLWGTAAYGEVFIETEAAADHDLPAELAADIARLSRNTATPDVAGRLTQVWYETDIRPLLPAIRVPTLLMADGGDALGVEELEYVATQIPDSRSVAVPGSGEIWRQPERYLPVFRDFLGIDEPVSLDTVLSTVLFTDIVDSTRIQAERGDREWRELIERHHAMVRDLLQRFQGLEQDTAGDGFFARFDGPARAIRCAYAITEAVRPLGIEVRAGLHTGECEIADGKCSGLAVSIGARVVALAGASEVLVSQTVKDLVAGSGLEFADAGEHELKGVPDRWHLYRVVG
jgi:class 3 adenylate cyclase